MSQSSIALPEVGIVSGLQVVQLINAALDAVASRQAGDQDPGPIGAWQFWADTVNKRVKMRNGTNTAWIDIGPLGKAAVEMPSAVAFFATKTPPSGWLRLNGAVLLIDSYQDLAAAIYCGDDVNATALFGYRCTNPANPSATRSITGPYIRLPDARGEFLRGWDDSRGVDSGRGFGTAQDGSVFPYLAVFKATSTSATLVGPNVNTLGDGIQISPTGDTTFGPGSGQYFGAALTPQGGGAAPVAYATRPRNLALLACIKY